MKLDQLDLQAAELLFVVAVFANAHCRDFGSMRRERGMIFAVGLTLAVGVIFAVHETFAIDELSFIRLGLVLLLFLALVSHIRPPPTWV
jgi:hypothetical protein